MALVVGAVAATAVGGLYAYRHFTQVPTLTVAAGSSDGEVGRVMSTVANRLGSTKANVRLKVVETANAVEAAKAFAAGRVDLSVVRGDVGDLASARAVVIVAQAVVMVIVPAGSDIESIDELKGKRVGVVPGPVNQKLVEVLDREYGLTRAAATFTDLAPGDSAKALQAKEVAAILVAMPLTERYLATLRGLLPRNAKGHPRVLAIESAGAIAAALPAYETYDIPKGTLRSAPPIPDDDLATLRVPFYLVANKALADDVVATLTRAIMDARSELVGAYPLLAQLSAPSTDKDAFIPAHAGAAAYFNGEEQGFFDRYGDALYYGTILVGALASMMAGAWRFIRSETGEDTRTPLETLYSLGHRVRNARSEADLSVIEEEIDNVLAAGLGRHRSGRADAACSAAVSLAALRLEHLIDQRRAMLVSSGTHRNS